MADAQLWGDCHTHSTYSDGLFSVEELSRFHESFGQDFRIQTDHLIVAVPEGRPAGKWLHAAQWPGYCAACRRATANGHVCIAGVELGWESGSGAAPEGWYHTKLLPVAGQPFPDESFFAGLAYAGLLAKAKAAGLRPIVAHIDQGAPLERLSGAEVCGLEVRGDIEETRPLIGRPSLRHWDRMLTAGHRVSISSGSDAHQPDLWAGSGLRTVVVDTPREAEAIAAAVAAGRSYLSATWHPDCYAAAGWPARPNSVAGGMTCFSPWWEFKEYDELRGRPPRALVVEIFEAALRNGRCRREDYPVLAAFSVGGALSGQQAVAGAKCEVQAAWRMHVPVRLARVIADGEPVLQLSAACPALRDAEGSLHETLDLRGRHYVRLEIEAADPAVPGQRETLLSNPVYLAG